MPEDREPTLSERLEEALCARFGMDWPRQPISLSVRLPDLTWLIRMIEKGIETQRQEWLKQSKSGRLDASEAASLGSFFIDAENLVNQAITAVHKLPIPKEKKA